MNLVEMPDRRRLSQVLPDALIQRVVNQQIRGSSIGATLIIE
jgi:hypothetical protein